MRAQCNCPGWDPGVAFQAWLAGVSHLVHGQEENRAVPLPVLLCFHRASSVPPKDLRVGSWDLVVGSLHREDFSLCWHGFYATLQFLSFAAGVLCFVFGTLVLAGNAWLRLRPAGVWCRKCWWQMSDLEMLLFTVRCGNELSPGVPEAHYLCTHSVQVMRGRLEGSLGCLGCTQRLLKDNIHYIYHARFCSHLVGP